jgi:integrase/recombinase XerD
MSRTAGNPTDIQPVEEWEKTLLMAQLPEHWQNVYELLWQTGIRITEALVTKRSDLQNGGIFITRSKRKDKRRDFMPLTPELFNKLQAVATKQKSVRIFPYTAAGAWAALKLAAKKAGVRETIHPHCFRHGMGYRAMEQTGGNLAMVKEILGHMNINSTQRYINPPKYKVENTLRDLNRKQGG